jgi:tetratricopeptide (TPR) repeat protein
MATQKKGVVPDTRRQEIPHEDAYYKAVEEFASAVEMLHQGKPAEARKVFERLGRLLPDEPAFSQRARTYAEICDRKLRPREDEPQTADELYYRGVWLANEGRADAKRLDEALSMFDRALALEKDSARILYARASAWALKRNPDAAVADLRKAVAADPGVRYQAASDPDFESVREEPAFIDLIEPTPTEA